MVDIKTISLSFYISFQNRDNSVILIWKINSKQNHQFSWEWSHICLTILSFDLVYLRVKRTNYLPIKLGGYLAQQIFFAVARDCLILFRFPPPLSKFCFVFNFIASSTHSWCSILQRCDRAHFQFDWMHCFRAIKCKAAHQLSSYPARVWSSALCYACDHTRTCTSLRVSAPTHPHLCMSAFERT